MKREELIREFMKRVQCLAVEVPGEVYDDFRPWAEQVAQLLREDGEALTQSREELEEGEIRGLQILYREVGAERDKYRAALGWIKREAQSGTHDEGLGGVIIRIGKIAHQSLCDPIWKDPQYYDEECQPNNPGDVIMGEGEDK